MSCKLKISGKTRVMGLFGYPVEHSLSPAMHNAAFEHLGLDCCYVTFLVRPELLNDAVKAIKALNLAGVSITVPHKENVIPMLDAVNKEASFIGAVNTIVNSDGKLIGYNTDGRGFIQSLSEEDISIEGKNILIGGAGGASRAISYYLSEKVSKLLIYDVDSNKVQRLIHDLRKIRNNVHHIDKINNLNGIDIIINATPLGLKETDPTPFDVSLIKPNHVVCDLIYRQTRLLKKSSEKGCKTLNGLGMLLWQGLLAFELWTGVKPPVEVMRKALLKG